MNTRITWILAGFVLTLVIAGIWTPHYKPAFPWHHVPGYLAWIGLAACVALILLAKFVLKPLLQRPDTETTDADPVTGAQPPDTPQTEQGGPHA